MVITILFLICLSILFTQFIEPWERIKEKLGIKMIDNKTSILKYILIKLFNCSKCFGFWLSLIYTQDIMIAVIVAVIVELISRNLLAFRL